ncbi:MAG: 2,3-bisphosphoglycerate-independent phosphoglycerate mutase [Myxococcales bacterium]|nr:2,3-bisphosphoglycerate-independent phosphoglycerate mutase [Myxococcales bacterium]
MTTPLIPGPLLIVVMDGVGIGPSDGGNAVTLARTPNLDRLAAEALHTRLVAHGRAVGLPSDDDMGNSEVGHNALGAGRVFDQGATLVERAIETGALFRGAAWQEVLTGETVHFIGLLSDGNVHSHERHLHAMLRSAAASGKRRLRVHILLDGRDVRDGSALDYVERLEGVLTELSQDGTDARIASGGGRMFVTMDRYESDWRIVERGWRAHVLADGERHSTASAAILSARAASPGISDQALPPFVVGEGSPILDGDSVVLFNFRGDRAMQLSSAFESGDTFTAFDRVRVPKVVFAGLMQYDGDRGVPRRFLVTPPVIDGTLTETLIAAGVRQWACSETQKFGHVTYFWNGNRADPIDPALDVWREIPSDLMPFEERPWMKSAELTDATVEALRSGAYGLLRINFPNGDMVGHTGALGPTILAVEAVDLALGRLMAALGDLGGTLLCTADHGNADEMWKRNKKGELLKGDDGGPVPSTSHSLAPVPLYLWPALPGFVLRTGGLANVAATVVELLGVPARADWAPSLLVPAAEP